MTLLYNSVINILSVKIKEIIAIYEENIEIY